MDQARFSGDELLRRMAQVYRTCRSYQDFGTVRLTYAMESPPRVGEQTFRTAFVRPDQFRFDYSSTRTRATNTIWRRGPEVRSKYEYDLTAKAEDSLGMALAGATGVSNGAAHTVPALLLPDEVGGWRLSDLGSVVRLEDASLGSIGCFRIRGLAAGGVPLTIWLDEAFVIRRIDERLPERFGAEQTTLYQPTINGAVAVEPLGAAAERLFPWGPLGALGIAIAGAALMLRSRRTRQGRRQKSEAAEQGDEADKA